MVDFGLIFPRNRIPQDLVMTTALMFLRVMRLPNGIEMFNPKTFLKSLHSSLEPSNIFL